MKKTISLLLVLVLCMVAKGDFTFGESTNLGPTVNSSSYDWSPSIPANGLELYFESDRPGGEGTYDIWVSTRATKEDDWGAATNLGAPINTPDWQNSPCISADGLELYYSDWGLRVVRRATVSDPWGEPENDSLININTSNINSAPCLSSDGLSLFLFSWDETDLYVSTRPTRDDLWSEPVNLGPTVNGVNSTWENRGPSISADGLVLFFSSDRPGGSGRRDLWMTRRSTIDGPWSEPVNLGPTINGDRSEYQPEISADGRTLLFCARRDSGHGHFDIWQAPIIPIVDFNGDGNINIDDLLIMIDNWNTDNSLCDIGPMPWGDGVVDKADLEVLMSYWGQEIDDWTLLAHWKLDETEGDIAHDSASNNIKAELYGDPVWRPADGMIDGALMLDGIDDFVGTWEIPALSSGDFSMFAWIKGGAAGQVVISEFHGVNWLMADASHGYLKTDLKEPGHTAQAQSLVSEVTITDGEWHRIGLTWDGTNRSLYVDAAAVASDTQVCLERYGIALNIGCGPYETPGTFFAGLIDDVRIYNRAITP